MSVTKWQIRLLPFLVTIITALAICFIVFYFRHISDIEKSIFLRNRVDLYKDALSRYFLLYLQDKKKLTDMYQELLKRDQSVMNIKHYSTLGSVILQVCEKPSLNDLQKDFSTWLNNVNSRL